MYINSTETMNNKITTKLQGFTLLEAMIAMAIIVLVFATGGFTIFRVKNSLELNNGHSDILSYIRTIQSRARNSLANGTVDSQTQIPNSPDLYAIRFNADSIDLLSCSLNGTSATCSVVDTDIEQTSLSSITVDSECLGIGFRRSTSDILELVNSNTVLNSGFCDIVVGHQNIEVTKTLRINFADNSIIGDLDEN